MDRFEKDKLEYIWSFGIEPYYKRIEEKSLRLSSVLSAINHLPVIGVERGFGKEGQEECRKMVAECLSRLWAYSQEMGYVDKGISLDTYIRSGMDFNYFNIQWPGDSPTVVHEDFLKFADWMKERGYDLDA